MIIIGGSYDVHPEDVAAFIAAVEKVTEGSRKEAGCRLYQFSRALDDPNRICLFEIWADRAAFDLHLTTPHFLAYRDTTAKLRTTRNVGRYDGKDLV